MAYTDNEKSTGLDVLTTLATGDLHIVGDVSDSGRAKAITQNNLETVIANSTNFVDQLVDNNYFTSELAGDTNFITELNNAGVSSLEVEENGVSVETAVNKINVLSNSAIVTNPLTGEVEIDLRGFGSGGGGGGGTKLAIDTTEVTTTSSTFQTAFTISIPAGTLGTNDGIRFYIPTIIGSGSGSTEVRVSYGGQTLGTIDPASGSGSTSIYGYILADGATNAQKSQLFNQALYDDEFNNALTVDSSINQDLLVEIRNTAAGTATITADAIIVEKISEGSTVSNVELVDDFLGGVYSTGATNEFYSISTLNWSGLSSGGTSIGGYINSETNHPGILRIEGSGTNEAAIFLGDPNNTIYPISQFAQSGNQYEFIVRCNDTTSQTVAALVKIGLTADVLEGNITNNEINIVFDTTNNDIIFKTRDGSTTQTTTIDSSFTAIFYNFKIVCDGTNVKCYQDGVLKATHSTNVPSTTVNGSMTFTALNGEQLDIDLAKLKYQATR